MMSSKPPSTASSGELRVEVARKGPALIYKLAGSAGMNVATDLKDRLLDQVDSSTRQLIIDLSDLDFISSVGLGGIIAAHIRCCHQNTVIKLVNPQPSIRQMLEVTKLEVLFPIHRSVDEALAAPR